MPDFKIVSDYVPSGDQPQAIDALVEGLNKGAKHQVLLEVTGSGKTFTIANVIQKLNRPALVVSHNKTLAAQLASEFKTFFRTTRSSTSLVTTTTSSLRPTCPRPIPTLKKTPLSTTR